MHRNQELIVKFLAQRDGWTCGICSKSIDPSITGMDGPSVDHIVPRSQGGANDPLNVRLAHMRCNSGHGLTKGCKFSEEVKERLGKAIRRAYELGKCKGAGWPSGIRPNHSSEWNKRISDGMKRYWANRMSEIERSVS
jgi:hypothetical protein